MAWLDSNVWKRGSQWRLSHTNGVIFISTFHKNKTLALVEGRRMLHEGRTKQLNIFKGDGTWEASEVTDVSNGTSNPIAAITKLRNSI